MCEFFSGVRIKTPEGDGILLYLTTDDLQSSRGRELRKRFGDDINGHGACREFYDILPGVGREIEITNFSTPYNFLEEVVEDIKAGKFRGFGNPVGLLCDPAHAEYKKIRDPACAEFEKTRDSACAEYQKIRNSAYAEFGKIRDPAYAEYQKIRNSAHAEYKKIRDSAHAEYKKIRDPACTEYQKIRNSAHAEYKKIRNSAYAEYQKIRDSAFWDLFAIKENRAKAWK